MKVSLNIRFAGKTDLIDLVELCEQHAIFEQRTYNRKGKKEALEKYLFSETPTLFCLVVEMNTKLIGYSTFMKQFSTWNASFYVYMDCLFLNETSRSYGIGEQLINRIEKEAQKLQCECIQWQTPQFNKRAMKFYDRIGATSKTKERYFLTTP